MRLARLLVSILFALAACAVPSAGFAQAAGGPALRQSDQPFRHGVNVLGYDPYWNVGGKRRFEWRHFAEIHKAGFDFVRVNLQAFKHMDAKNRLEPQWLAKLDDVVREAQKAGLGVILDEHDFDVCSQDVGACRTKLSAFWQQVAPRYAKAPRSVAFELLNEPHDKLNGEVWNGLLVDLLARCG
ncbi:MAG TPA: cellulase family glycosylhydrolase [Sphingomicrobium sp.]